MKSAPIFSVELLFIDNFWFDKKTPSRMSRKRSPNFSQIEIEILLDEVEKNRAILFSKFSNVSTSSSKKRAWEAICEKINKANNIDHCRTVEEVKKKWSSYMSETKKKALQNRRETGKTGGGPPPQGLNPTLEKIVRIIGCTPISGIEGGIDTCEVTEKNDILSVETACSSDSTCASIAPQCDLPVSRDVSVESGPSKKRKKEKDSEDFYENKLLSIEEEKLSIMRQIDAGDRKGTFGVRQRLTI
ncbi:uncharacterized protein LOC133188240 [Saccostrea echinata]|uniref:uncharacterized protein LOC133188240 n=1 Tax=Saccostrea echinata TaxID=191078 RepID=UPI002A7FD5E2|nr:uncharacterized protein LOC133188240 [Saccostrea echinata]